MSSLSENFLNALYKGLVEAVLAVNVDMRHVVYWNNGAEAMFGYSREEVLERPIDLLYPDDASFQQMYEISTPIIQQCGYWRGEWEFRHRDGSHFPAQVTCTTFLQTRSADTYAVVVIHDRAERKQMEETLQKQNAFVKLLQEIATTANEATTGDEALQVAIKQICAHTGWCIGHVYLPTENSTHPLVASAIWYLGDATQFEPFRKYREENRFVVAGELPSRVFLSGKPEWSLDITGDPHCSGAEVARQVGLKAAFAFPVLVGKEAVAVMEFFSAEAVEPDAPLLEVMTNIGAQLGRVFERKQVERQLNENERLAAMGVTVAKVVHEIGNPLNGMYTTVQLLERDLAQQEGPLNDTLRSTVQDLSHEVDRLRSLLLELRSLSHPRQLDLQPTDLAALTTGLLSIEMPRWTESGIRVEQNFPPYLPLVLADGEKLKQVLLNLCKNAVEAMPEGGTLTVRGYTAREQVCLEIHDTGVGIPDGVEVFELFSTTKSGGTGIGLAIVRQIVAAHGGRITYTSRPGKGTVFQVTFPLPPLPEG